MKEGKIMKEIARCKATITIEYEVDVEYPNSWNMNEIEEDLKSNYEQYINEDDKKINVEVWVDDVIDVDDYPYDDMNDLMREG